MILLAVIVGLGVASVVVVPAVRRRSADRRRAEDVERAAADVADLLVVVLGSGAPVLDGVRWVAERGPHPVRPAFAAVIERTTGGTALAPALRVLADELGSPYRSLVAALIAASRDGAPTEAILLRLGDEARAARRRQIDRDARTLPVQLLFPLVVCSLPAVVFGAVAPLILVAIGRL